MAAKSRTRSSRSSWLAFGFIAPALLGLLLFVAGPFLWALGMSFTDLRLGSPLPVQWMGLAQFYRVLSDPSFGRALMNNALFALIVVPLQTSLALMLALMINQPLKGRVLFRTLFFLPIVFPLSLVAVVWILIYAPGPNGMMNAGLEWITLGAWEPRDFLHDPVLAFPAIMLTSIWQGTGFQMVILLAGLQAIPESLYEAAAIDGAGRWPRFWYVTLPQLKNTLIFVVLVTTILAFRLFDQVQIMTQGGPQDVTTTVMVEAVQAAFSRLQVAKAAAMTVVLFGVVLIITGLQRRLVRHEGEVA
jgi:multiple sugar transport system permease protein